MAERQIARRLRLLASRETRHVIRHGNNRVAIVAADADRLLYSKSWEQTKAILDLLGWQPKPRTSMIGNETPTVFEIDPQEDCL